MDWLYFLATDRDPFHETTLDLVLNTPVSVEDLALLWMKFI